MCGPLRGSGFEIAGIMVSVSSVWRYLATGIFEGVLKGCANGLFKPICAKE